MSTSLPDARATPRAPGIIDTLQGGFNAVNRHAWLLILPLAIDLLIWQGPQITVGQSSANAIAALAPATADPLMLSISGAGGEASAVTLRQFTEGLTRFNVLSLLVVPAFGVPSFRAGAPGVGPLIAIDSVPALVGCGVLSLLVGLVLAAFFYGLMGQAVREGRASLVAFTTDWGRLSLAVGGLFCLAVAVVVVFGTPLAMLLAFANASAPALGRVLAPIIAGVVVWVLVNTFFAMDALFVNRLSPLLAVRMSFEVVRRNLWSSIGLIGLIVLINTGLAVLWTEIANSLKGPGVAVGSLGHIYVSAGLAAGSMTYYKERCERMIAPEGQPTQAA